MFRHTRVIGFRAILSFGIREIERDWFRDADLWGVEIGKPYSVTGNSTSALTGPESDGKVRGSMDVECFSRFPRFIADPFQVGKVLKESAEGDPGLHPRQRGAKAEVDTVAEGDVRIGVAGNVEFFGLLKVFWVAIGRADDGKNELARREGLAA